MSLCLTVLLSCSSGTLVKTEVIYVNPPEILLRQIPVPEPNINTNKDLLEYTIELQSIIKQLNNDKQSITSFVRSQNNNE